jgi:protein MpaA
MRKLGQNHGGYHGEQIDLAAVLRSLEASAPQHGWQRQCFGQRDGVDLHAWHRPGVPGARRIYLSAGIHGDEPAAPLAVARLLAENRWPEAALWAVPCLNPGGFQLNRRENPDGLDLNRDYREPRSPEIRAHRAWLAEQPAFELALCLHEDWEAHGFYLYEVNPDQLPSRAEAMIRAVEEVCPIDRSEIIEGRVARGGIIRPVLTPMFERSDWPEAFYLITHQTRLSYTLEAPSDFPLATRVNALVAGTLAAMGAAP